MDASTWKYHLMKLVSDLSNRKEISIIIFLYLHSLCRLKNYKHFYLNKDIKYCTSPAISE